MLENDAATLSNWPAKLPSRTEQDLFNRPIECYDSRGTIVPLGTGDREEVARSNEQPSFALASRTRCTPVCADYLIDQLSTRRDNKQSFD